MTVRFKLSSTRIAVLLAFPLFMAGLPVFADEPYPSLPPTLSTSVTPNIMLLIDTSGSMGDTLAGDSQSKIVGARSAAYDLVNNNPTLRWGLFTFDGSSNSGTLRAPIGTSVTSIKSTLLGLSANGGDTPLGETTFEVSRYWAGEASYYGKTTNLVDGKYVSPIQYRCQKNFNIILSDGFSNGDNNLPGIKGKAGVTYIDGNQVSKTFKACTDATTLSSVTCNSKLEDTATTINNPDFPAGWPDPSVSSNAFDKSPDNKTFTANRSVRDIAMYMYDRDFKVGGLDTDGQSYDDPSFIKQNVSTFAIGFGKAIPVLNAAAIVGHGSYYTSANKAQLTAALTNAVNSIANQASNAGGAAVLFDTTKSGNKVYQPIFNPDGWYGELRCFDYNTAAANGIGYPCTPNAKAVIPAATGRNIYSNIPWSNPGATAFPAAFAFNDSTGFSSMTATQKTLLGATSADQKNVINYIRGVAIAGYRTRSNGLLGDIVDAQPTVVATPTGVSDVPSYATFTAANTGRNIVFIGANDGMLHAFDGNSMNELMGYVPSAVYSKLKPLTATDYGVVAGTNPHAYHVNGGLRNLDVLLGGTWKTLLVGGLAQGGQGYFAIDATNTTSLASSTAIKWEWNDTSDADMGYTFGAPTIYNVRTSASTAIPAVIMNNGYKNSFDDTARGGQKAATDSGALYIVNADTGALIKKISVPGSTGLSEVAGVDYGKDGILDYVYAGDLSGKLWRFDLTDSNPANFKVAATPIFDANADVPAGAHPIVFRPAILPVNKTDGSSAGNLILFGTGSLLTNGDRSDTTQQTFYAVLDDMSATPTTVKRSELVAQTVTDTYTQAVAVQYSAGTYRKLSSNTIDLTSPTNTRKGWYIDLPESSERVTSSPYLYDDHLEFGTGVTITNQACVSAGRGWMMQVNPLTGSVAKWKNKEFSVIDVYLDGKATAADLLPFSSGTAYASGFGMTHIPTDQAHISATVGIYSSDGGTDSGLGRAGHTLGFRDANFMGVYVANAAPGVTKGVEVGMPFSSGTGSEIVCQVGDLTCQVKNNGSHSTGIKVIPTTWRELKQ